jgi:hypothetical protein
MVSVLLWLQTGQVNVDTRIISVMLFSGMRGGN